MRIAHQDARRGAPTPPQLAKQLGPAYKYYLGLTSQCRGCAAEWRKGTTGWLLKLHDGKKALCYIVPGNSEFSVNLTIRPDERIAFLADPHLEDLYDRLQQAQLVSEGYVLRLSVKRALDAKPIQRIVQAICQKRELTWNGPAVI